MEQESISNLEICRRGGDIRGRLKERKGEGSAVSRGGGQQ